MNTQRAVAQKRQQIQLGLMFYLGWPLMLGIILGWTGAGTIGGQLPKYYAIAYWVIGILSMTFSLEVSTHLAASIASRIASGKKIPLIILCLLSIPVFAYISAPITYLWQTSFLGLTSETVREFDRVFITSFDQYLGSLTSSVVITLEWVIVNLMFDRVLGFARFRNVTGYEPPARYLATAKNNEAETESLPVSASLFLKKLPKKLGTEVIAMSAEDHYVKVYTILGKDLVLYRFSDAVAEMPKDIGFQVHRSHWVKKSAITGFQKHSNGQILVLNEALEIPVSKRYIEVLKANGIEPID